MDILSVNKINPASSRKIPDAARRLGYHRNEAALHDYSVAMFDSWNDLMKNLGTVLSKRIRKRVV
ncbi:MAG: hypothetical protein ACI4UV_03475 [Victivallales bacterium]